MTTKSLFAWKRGNRATSIPEGEIIEVLGPQLAPGIDMLSIVRKYRFCPLQFPKSVLDEANRIPQSVEQKLIQGAKICAINSSSRSILMTRATLMMRSTLKRSTTTGVWRLGVHIADVAAYVTPDSALDREARRRGNSVYLPDRVIPMLPERSEQRRLQL